MKKTIIALLALAGLAAATETTITPLKDDGWTLGKDRTAGSDTNKALQNKEDGTIYSNDPWWKRPEANYDLPEAITLTQPDHVLSFIYKMSFSLIDPTNALCTVALEGTSGATAATIMTGFSYGSANFQSAVVANNTSTAYIFTSATSDWNNAYGCTSSQTLAPMPSKADSGKTEFETTISGNIAWNEEKSAFVLNLTQTYNNTDYNQSYVLGSTYEMSGISIVMDGDSTNESRDSFTVSNMSITYTPEPATATLSLLALAGLAARRRRH